MSDHTPHRILVIDDVAEIHDDIRKILCQDRKSTTKIDAAEAAIFGTSTSEIQQSQFQIDSAYQGEVGLARVYHAIQEGWPYSMAFVDVRMPPGWDGIEVTPRLWIADPDLQIVICTAYSDYTWEDMFARLGTGDRMLILKKPFEPIEVLQIAHNLTEKRERLMRRKTKEPQSISRNQLIRTGEGLQTEIIRLKKDSKEAEEKQK